MYLVAILTDAASATQILASVKGSMMLSKEGKFYAILGKLGEKDTHFQGTFSNVISVSCMSKDALIP